MAKETDNNLYNTAEAARYLGVSPYSLRRARVTGLLSGIKAPSFLRADASGKHNATCFYERSELDAYRSRLTRHDSTGEYDAQMPCAKEG